MVLSALHIHIFPSSNTFPASHHIQPQTCSENLSVLFQPQGSAVNDRDQIADPMEEDSLTRLSLCLDYSSSTCSGNIELYTLDFWPFPFGESETLRTE